MENIVGKFTLTRGRYIESRIGLECLTKLKIDRSDKLKVVIRLIE